MASLSFSTTRLATVSLILWISLAGFSEPITWTPTPIPTVTPTPDPESPLPRDSVPNSALMLSIDPPEAEDLIPGFAQILEATVYADTGCAGIEKGSMVIEGNFETLEVLGVRSKTFGKVNGSLLNATQDSFFSPHLLKIDFSDPLIQNRNQHYPIATIDLDPVQSGSSIARVVPELSRFESNSGEQLPIISSDSSFFSDAITEGGTLHRIVFDPPILHATAEENVAIFDLNHRAIFIDEVPTEATATILYDPTNMFLEQWEIDESFWDQDATLEEKVRGVLDLHLARVESKPDYGKDNLARLVFRLTGSGFSQVVIPRLRVREVIEDFDQTYERTYDYTAIFGNLQTAIISCAASYPSATPPPLGPTETPTAIQIFPNYVPDDRINAADLLVFLERWLRDKENPPDLDGDHEADMRDLLVVQKYWQFQTGLDESTQID